MKENNFKQWCIDNNRLDILSRWDYGLNQSNPEDFTVCSNKKFWFKCPNNRHESELKNIQYLTVGKQTNLLCSKCESFAQDIIDSHSEEYLYALWNKNNKKTPWEIKKGSTYKATFNCENGHIYDRTIQNFYKNKGCPYCTGAILTKKNSLGAKYPQVFDIWSEDNEKTPYDYKLNSTKEIVWKCPSGKHSDYIRKISASLHCKFRCPECSRENQGLFRLEDLTGQKFGLLTVIKYNKDRSETSRQSYWDCKCECGAEITTYAAALKDGRQKTCGNKKLHYSGDNNPGWKGGKTPELVLHRNNVDYDKWKTSVYAKDWYTCQCCGKSKNIKKNAHHLINFASNIASRYDVDNGILLCEDCHASTKKGTFHTIYGIKNNTPEQLEEYINNKRQELGISIPFSMAEYKSGKILKPGDVVWH